MKKLLTFLFLCLLSLVFVKPAYAPIFGPPGFAIEEEDADPKGRAVRMKFANGTLTKNADGSWSHTQAGAAFDSTTVHATTWSDGTKASNIWTFDVSGTDHTMTIGNALMTFSQGVTVSGTLEGGTITEGGNAVYNSTETPGGVLGGTWATPTLDSNVGSFAKSFMITSPTATADGAVWRVPAACTITAVHGVQVGGTNVVGHLTECDADGLNPAGVDGATDMTITTSNVNDDGTLSNPSIDSGDYIGWRTTSVSGTITRVTISFEGTYD